MIHRGVKYTISATEEPDIWRWRFEIGDVVRSGRTQTRLAELAARRVQSKIDATLRALASSVPQESSRIELACAPEALGPDPESSGHEQY